MNSFIMVIVWIHCLHSLFCSYDNPPSGGVGFVDLLILPYNGFASYLSRLIFAASLDIWSSCNSSSDTTTTNNNNNNMDPRNTLSPFTWAYPLLIGSLLNLNPSHVDLNVDLSPSRTDPIMTINFGELDPYPIWTCFELLSPLI